MGGLCCIASRAMSHVPPEIEHPVAPLEFFFDLVFVFACMQVTTLLSNYATWSGLGHSH
jgi:low temperature requirement protein LtrA